MKKIIRKIIFLAAFNLLASLILFNSANNPIKPALAASDACDNPYMPLASGDQIEYKTTSASHKSSYVMKVIEAKPGFAKIEYDMNMPSKVVMQQNIFCKDGNISTDTYMDFFSSAGSLQMKADTKEVSGELMPKDIKVGSTWTNKYIISYHYGGLNLPKEFEGYEMAITTTNKVLSEEKVTVPAGSYQALKVESTNTADISMPNINLQIPEAARSRMQGTDLSKLLNQKAITSTSVTMYEWWVKNIGLVKIASASGGTSWETVAIKIGVSNSWLDNPTIEAVAEKAVAPTVATAAVVNTAIATQSMVSVDFLHYLIFFITQPLLFFKRKKIKAWGTVYNALSGLPEDLVVVRLQEAKSGKLITTQVTDSFGRFVFLAPTGQYKITVTKRDFVFPSIFLKATKSDILYADLYHGETIEVGKEGMVLTPNIPIDPQVKDLADAKIQKKYLWQKYQNTIALASPALGGASLIIKPSLIVVLLFILSILMYFFFRRFAVKKSPKKWGRVMTEKEASSLPGTIMRIFALPYNKLVDYRVTDKQGRYNFLVGNKKFFLTLTKDGYQKEQTKTFDFSGKSAANIIAEDFKLKKI